MTEQHLEEMARDFLKNIPYDTIIQVSKQQFPKLTSEVLLGDKISMNNLAAKFHEKSKEIDDTQTKFMYFATGLFWTDKAAMSDGFACPKCGSLNTVTSYIDRPKYSCPKGDSFCKKCDHKWLIRNL